MDKTSRAVIPGSRLFTPLFGLPRSAKNIAGLFFVRTKAAPLQSEPAVSP
jgi:hypothetical protein